MYITVFNAVKERLKAVATLEWHRGAGDTPCLTPGILFELPKEISWEQDPSGMLSGRAPLALHIVTDAPLRPDEPVQAEDLKDHFAMADAVMSLLNEMEIRDDQDRIVACYFVSGPTRPVKIEKDLARTILTFDVEWRNYALVNNYDAYNPEIEINPV
jgi:hypothetical protein